MASSILPLEFEFVKEKKRGVALFVPLFWLSFFKFYWFMHRFKEGFKGLRFPMKITSRSDLDLFCAQYVLIFMRLLNFYSVTRRLSRDKVEIFCNFHLLIFLWILLTLYFHNVAYQVTTIFFFQWHACNEIFIFIRKITVHEIPVSH